MSNDKSEKEKWSYWGDWKDNPLYYSLWVSLKRSNVYKELDLDKIIKADAMHLEGHFFTLEEDFSNIKPIIIDAIEGEGNWFSRLFYICNREVKKLDSINKSNISLVFNQILECLSCSVLIHISDRIVEPYLREIADREKISFNDIFSQINPANKTPLLIYQQELKKVREKDIDQFVKKYLWVGTHDLEGEGLTKDKVLIQLANLDKTKHSIERYRFSEKIDKTIKICSEMAFHRSNLVENSDRTIFSCRKEIINLGKKYNLSFEEVKLMTFYELVDLEKNGKLMDLSSRKSGCGVNLIDDKYVILIGKELEEKISYYLSDDYSKIKELSGSIGFKGNVRSIAKIVQTIKDTKKIHEGDIIVATETTPDFIIAMQKASAFVTDIGGITSHAAIISREMKKPCIIGTKVATKVLHDGDLVEVDANKGIVKILKRVNT